jgi:hypothetical protein
MVQVTAGVLLPAYGEPVLAAIAVTKWAISGGCCSQTRLSRNPNRQWTRSLIQRYEPKSSTMGANSTTRSWVLAP